MGTEYNNTDGQFYYSSDNDKTWKPIGSITEIKKVDDLLIKINSWVLNSEV